jgi:recombination protein RecT
MSREKLPGKKEIIMAESQALVLSSPKDMLAYLQKSKSSITMALPAHLNPDRMLRLALTCFSTTPKLRECTANSIVASIVVASQLGLEPGVTGQGYLIPYGKTCTFIPGWQGLVGLLNNTGRATAWTGSVFEGDEWDFELGSAPKCHHKPGKNYGDPEKLIWVYACGKVNGSEQPVVEAWPMGRVLKHRDRYNKVGQKHYSYTNLEMYARKVVLLQVLKYMPRSVELNNAILAADAGEMGRSTRVEQGLGREDSTIIELDPETEEKFTPGKVNPPSGSAEKPTETPPGNVVNMPTGGDDDDAELKAEIAANKVKAEAKAKEEAEAKRMADDKAKAEAAATAAPRNPPPTAKAKAPDWNSDRDKPLLMEKLKANGCTQAQLGMYLKESFLVESATTIDIAEGICPKTLAKVLFKFDAIVADIKKQPGSSAV